MGGESFIPRPQVVHLLGRAHKTHVRHRPDKTSRIGDDALAHGAGPELQRLLKLLENIDRFGDVDRAVGFAVRRVAEFADSGVTGPGIVPAMRCFRGKTLGRFKNRDAQFRVQFFE